MNRANNGYSQGDAQSCSEIFQDIYTLSFGKKEMESGAPLFLGLYGDRLAAFFDVLQEVGVKPDT
jgi:hypothetical protein